LWVTVDRQLVNIVIEKCVKSFILVICFKPYTLGSPHVNISICSQNNDSCHMWLPSCYSPSVVSFIWSILLIALWVCICLLSICGLCQCCLVSLECPFDDFPFWFSVAFISHWYETLAQKRGKYQNLEKKYAPALDIYGQTCFVRSDF
jgi:hypothetical protein